MQSWKDKKSQEGRREVAKKGKTKEEREAKRRAKKGKEGTEKIIGYKRVCGVGGGELKEGTKPRKKNGRNGKIKKREGQGGKEGIR